MNELYNYLEELLTEPYIDSDIETNTQSNNNLNLPSNDVDIINDIYTNDQEPTQNQNQDNGYLLQLYNNYISNNQYLTNLNQNIHYINNTNNTNMISNEFTYTNLVYYNNT